MKRSLEIYKQSGSDFHTGICCMDLEIVGPILYLLFFPFPAIANSTPPTLSLDLFTFGHLIVKIIGGEGRIHLHP